MGNEKTLHDAYYAIRASQDHSRARRDLIWMGVAVVVIVVGFSAWMGYAARRMEIMHYEANQ